MKPVFALAALAAFVPRGIAAKDMDVDTSSSTYNPYCPVGNIYCGSTLQHHVKKGLIPMGVHRTGMAVSGHNFQDEETMSKSVFQCTADPSMPFKYLHTCGTDCMTGTNEGTCVGGTASKIARLWKWMS